MIVHSDTYLSIFSMYQFAYEVEPSSTSELRPQLGPFWQLSAHMRSPCRMPKGAGWMMYSYHDISWSLSLKYCQVLISHDFNRKSLWATLQNHPTSGSLSGTPTLESLKGQSLTCTSSHPGVDRHVKHLITMGICLNIPSSFYFRITM